MNIQEVDSMPSTSLDLCASENPSIMAEPEPLHGLPVGLAD
jgi:hypothetical protein